MSDEIVCETEEAFHRECARYGASVYRYEGVPLKPEMVASVLKPVRIVYRPPAPKPLPAPDAELLAWARKKAASPWEWGPERGRCRCVFCGWEQMVRWDGGIEAHHNDGCLAVRANTGPKP